MEKIKRISHRVGFFCPALFQRLQTNSVVWKKCKLANSVPVNSKMYSLDFRGQRAVAVIINKMSRILRMRLVNMC